MFIRLAYAYLKYDRILLIRLFVNILVINGLNVSIIHTTDRLRFGHEFKLQKFQ